MPGIEEFLTKHSIPFTTNKSSLEIKTPYGTIINRSYSNPERIISYECYESYIDELDVLSRDKAEYVFRKITERNRQIINGKNGAICITSTADQGTSGFVYEKFGNITDHDHFKLIQGRTEDNIYLPKEYVAQLKKNYTPKQALCYLEGLFIAINENAVYPEYNREENHASVEIDKHDYIIATADFNVSGCVITLAVEQDEQLFFFDEHVVNNTREMAEYLVRSFGADRVTVFPDSSGAHQSTNSAETDHDILRSYNLTINAPKANPRINDRVNTVNASLYHKTVWIDKDKCKKLSQSLEQQRYDINGKPEKSSSHDGGAVDDFCDSFGYGVHRLQAIIKPTIRTSTKYSQGA